MDDTRVLLVRKPHELISLDSLLDVIECDVFTPTGSLPERCAEMMDHITGKCYDLVVIPVTLMGFEEILDNYHGGGVIVYGTPVHKRMWYKSQVAYVAMDSPLNCFISELKETVESHLY